MIDLHCHLLPAVDDGAQDAHAALDMVRMASDDGITHITFTPHVQPGRYENTLTTLRPVFEKFRNCIEFANIPVTVALGGEVRLSSEILELVSRDEAPFLGSWNGKDVMLLELPHSHVPPGCDKLIEWLLKRDIVPMIAHPERNKDIMRDFSKVIPFVDLGCLFQVTAMSVTGEFGSTAQERAIEMLERGWVTILASDAHNLSHRPPVLSRAYEAAVNIVGKVAAKELVMGHPLKIVEGS